MIYRNYFIEVLIIILGLVLVVVIIMYPKQTLIKLPLAILDSIFVEPFRDIFGWFANSDSENEDKPYRTKKLLKVSFDEGEKYVFAFYSNKNLKQVINGFLDVFNNRYLIERFNYSIKEGSTIAHLPKEITFYDYHLLIQHLGDELGQNNCFGIYRSENLTYYIFKDNETLNNLLGFTSSNKRFSIHMLDDLENKQFLRLNQNLNFDTNWVEQHVTPDHR